MKIAKCKLCKNKEQRYKMPNSGTSSLKRHLMKSHKKLYEEEFPQEATTSGTSSICGSNNIKRWIQNCKNDLNSTGQTENKTLDLETEKNKFMDLLVEYTVKKYLLFNFFEDDITHQLYNYINPNLIVPSRNQLKSRIFSKFDVLKNSVKILLNACHSKISFTMDGWSSHSMKGYYGVAVHFIDSNWTLHSFLLDFVPAKGQHTGVSMATLFFKITTEFNITHSIQGITTDNTNSNFTFLKELENIIENFDGANKHYVCFAHILDLAARDLMKVFELTSEENEDEDSDTSDNESTISENTATMAKVKVICKKIKNSEMLRLNFAKFCDSLNLHMTIPKLEVKTRWNSTLEMLSWALQFKRSINILCDNTDTLLNFRIHDTEWNVIERTCKYLQSFKTLTAILEGEKYSTLPMVVIGINMLLDKLERWAHELDNKENRDDLDAKIILALQAARDKIVKHYNRTNWMYCIVLVLDPRHKIETFSLTTWGQSLKDEAIKKFEEIYKENYYSPYTDKESPQTQTECTVSVFELFEKKSDEVTDFDLDLFGLFQSSPKINRNENSWRYEIDKYAAESRADSTEDILKWWKRHETVFPTLSKMARDFLATPATSACIERYFSRASLTVTKKRNRLNDQSIRTLMCLNSWLQQESLTNITQGSQEEVTI